MCSLVFDLLVEVYPERLQGSRRARDERINHMSSRSSLLLTGCLARTAVDIVTLPVKVAGKVVDVATTSQSEADRNRGREIRKAEERERREAKRQKQKQKKSDDD